MDSEPPITHQPRKRTLEQLGFKSPKDDCRPEDCCCCCLFVYLLFGKEIQSPYKYQSPSNLNAKSSETKANYCYYNDLSDEVNMAKNGWMNKLAIDGSEAWLGLAHSSSSNNCSHSSQSPFSHQADADSFSGDGTHCEDGGDADGHD
ncbi:hypothetical protein HDE_10079 [Halotydeus destructor]|nr:hypothetical protein HDE_10079 [Halotydeus destructor]